MSNCMYFSPEGRWKNSCGKKVRYYLDREGGHACIMCPPHYKMFKNLMEGFEEVSEIEYTSESILYK